MESYFVTLEGFLPALFKLPRIGLPVFRLPAPPIPNIAPPQIPRLPIRIPKAQVRINNPIRIPKNITNISKISTGNLIPKNIKNPFSKSKVTGNGYSDLLDRMQSITDTSTPATQPNEIYPQSENQMTPAQPDEIYSQIETRLIDSINDSNQLSLDGFKLPKFKLPFVKTKPIFKMGTVKIFKPSKIKLSKDQKIAGAAAAAIGGVIAALPTGGTSLAAAGAAIAGATATAGAFLTSGTGLATLTAAGSLYQATQTGNLAAGASSLSTLGTIAGINTKPLDDTVKIGSELYSQGENVFNQGSNLLNSFISTPKPEQNKNPLLSFFNQSKPTTPPSVASESEPKERLMDVNIQGNALIPIVIGIGFILYLNRKGAK